MNSTFKQLTRQLQIIFELEELLIWLSEQSFNTYNLYFGDIVVLRVQISPRSKSISFERKGGDDDQLIALWGVLSDLKDYMEES